MSYDASDDKYFYAAAREVLDDVFGAELISRIAQRAAELKHSAESLPARKPTAETEPACDQDRAPRPDGPAGFP